MVLVPMIAVLDRCWLRATMIEARSQGGKAASEKVAAASAGAAWVWCGFRRSDRLFRCARLSSASSVSNDEAARESQERMPEGYWQVLGCEGVRRLVTGPVLWVGWGGAVVVVLSSLER